MKKTIFLTLLFLGSLHTVYANAPCIDSGKVRHSGNGPCNPPVVQISSDTSVCEGDTAVLTVSGGTTYLWNTGQTTTRIKVIPLLTTTYSVTAYADTCKTNASTTVTVVPSPYGCYILPTTATVCPGSGGVNFYLQGPMGPWSCSWSPSTYLTCNNCTSTTSNPTSSITYTVTIIDSITECTKIVIVPVTVSSSLTASISGPSSLCKGNSATLTASGGSTYLWNNGSTANLISVDPFTTTTYTVKVSSGSCADSATFKLFVDSCGPLGINTVVQNKASVTLYPNPNNGQFTLAFSHPELISENQTLVEVYNILGARVYYTTIKQVQNENAIHLVNQPSGVYFYRVMHNRDGLIGEGKFIIK